MQRLFALLAPLGVAGVVFRHRADPVITSCGKVASLPNARPKDFADRKETAWNGTAGKMLPVTFAAGEEITFECMPGFTLDGSKDGAKEFKVECTEYGYYKPKGTCHEASKCGALPEIAHAVPTGKVDKSTGKAVVEYTCQPGYSLDGEKVIVGGTGKNSLFTLDCIEFSGTYSEFKGECKAADFIPAAEATKIYTQVFEALFHVSCKGKVQTHFSMGKDSALDNVCAKVQGSSAECASIVSKIKAEFQTALAKREEEKKGKDWYEKTDLTNIDDEADLFCKKLWELVAKPNP